MPRMAQAIPRPPDQPAASCTSTSLNVRMSCRCNGVVAAADTLPDAAQQPPAAGCCARGHRQHAGCLGMPCILHRLQRPTPVRQLSQEIEHLWSGVATLGLLDSGGELLACPCHRSGGGDASASVPSCNCLSLVCTGWQEAADEAKQLRGGGGGWAAALLQWPAGSCRDRVSSHLPRPHAAKGACCICLLTPLCVSPDGSHAGVHSPPWCFRHPEARLPSMRARQTMVPRHASLPSA